MSNPIVLDLSHHQPEPINWDAVRSGGTDGVILKCSEGTSYVDPTFDERAWAADASGLYVGAYHYLKQGSVAEQMRWFTSNVDLSEVAIERLVIDYEDADCTLDDLTEAVEWLRTHAPPRDWSWQIAIYSGHKIKEDLGSDYIGELSDTSLWIAQYTEAAAPSWPKTQWPVWSLWQYTDKASVAGIDGPVDGNRWNGDPLKLQDWFYKPDGEPLPRPADKHVYVSIEVPEGVTVSVVVNGAVQDESDVAT